MTRTSTYQRKRKRQHYWKLGVDTRRPHRSDNGVSEDRAPISVTLVGRQNDAAALVSCTDELKENRCAQLVQRQVSHLVDDQDARSQVHAHAPVEPAFPIGPTEIGNEVMCGHEISAEAGLDGGFGQCDAEMRFADAWWSKENHVTGFVDETQRSQLANLPFVDRRLKAEIELIEVLYKGQMRQLKSRPQISATPRIHFTTQQIPKEIRVAGFGLRSLFEQIFEPG